MMATAPSATNTFEIPLSGDPEAFTIPLAGTPYQITIYWNNQDQGGWMMDLADQNGKSLAAGIPLITGVDLLDGLEYLGIQGSFYVITNGANLTDVPTFDNLGSDSNLYFASATGT